MTIEDEIAKWEWEPYDVQCARCGVTVSCEEAVPWEWDEWECFPCYDKLEAEQKAALAEYEQKARNDQWEP